MTREELIEFAEEQKEIFGGTMANFLDTAIECLKNNIWHRTAIEKPIIEKEYLCCTIDERYRIKTFRVLYWANDLYEVDDFDFADKRLKSGFYYYDSEYGYIDCDCTYWKELDWSDEE